jgi:hypothetical protein
MLAAESLIKAQHEVELSHVQEQHQKELDLQKEAAKKLQEELAIRKEQVQEKRLEVERLIQVRVLSV